MTLQFDVETGHGRLAVRVRTGDLETHSRLSAPGMEGVVALLRQDIDMACRAALAAGHGLPRRAALRLAAGGGA